MIPTWQKVDKLEQIAEQAKQECEVDQYNLCLSYEFDISLTDSAFVQAYRARAEQWMSEEVPLNLHFTHGAYFKGEKGTDYVARELTRKDTSRRALLSLLHMEDLFASHDDPIPAFLILQFGIDQQTLYVTAYFRALEVERFLPINLAEICLHCKKIRQKIPRLKKVRLLVIAFRGYRKPDFPCLEKAELDSTDSVEVGIAVAEKNYDQLRKWIGGKKQPDSAIVLTGLEALVKAVARRKAHYGEPFLEQLQKALTTLDEIKKLREATSEGPDLDRLYGQYQGHLDEALRRLEELAKINAH